MDYKELYKELLEKTRRLELELESVNGRGTPGSNETSTGMILKAFHSTSYLMAISKLDTGIYIDVNNSFIKELGYGKDEIIGYSPDDIHLFADFEESNKYLKLISKLRKTKDYPITLKTKEGKEKSYLFSAEKVVMDKEVYLLTVFNELSDLKDKMIKESQGSVLDEIFETVNSYLAIYGVSEDNRFLIIDLNLKVEEIEFIKKEEVIGKFIDDTPLSHRVKLIELLNHIRITGDAHKLSASPKGNDSEGYYMGFILTSGNIVITWEPGNHQKYLDTKKRQKVAFESFADMLPQMVYEVDLHGKIIYANKKSLDFFGYSADDLKNGVNISVLFPEVYKDMIENLKKLKFPEEFSSNKYITKKKDGSLVPILTHSFATFYDNKITGYRGVITDISKQVEYEQNIEREKAFLEHLIDSTPAAIAITDTLGKITMVNQDFSNLFGYKLEEALNKEIDDLLVPNDMKSDAIGFESISLSNRKVSKQTIRKDKNGRRIHVSLVVSAVVINNEIIAQLGIYTDITTEKKNQILQEILFNISTAALKEYDIKEIYPTIVKELSKIWDTNNFFIALYDKTSETLSFPFFADEKDNFYKIPTRKTITGWVIKNEKSVLLKENDLKILEEEGEIDLIGTPCKVWMGVPLNVEGNIIGVMCLQDYKEEDKFSQDDLFVLDFIANHVAMAIQRRVILDNLVAARQKAEDAAQSKQLFMTTMSHEIRTPLNEVIGITNLLLLGNPREDQMDYIQALKFSGNHLLTLVNDVLDYNKMDSGKIVFEQTQFNLSDFLDEIMRSYSFRSKAKNLIFEIKKSSNLPVEVIGDQIRLNQILSNLLSNAMKFTNNGSISVFVNELDRTGNVSKIEFTVADTGIGIPKDRLEDIFDSFTQASADTTRQFGGTGMGLAICKKLVELQGGTIAIESEPGKGSTFRFTISFGVSVAGSHPLNTEVHEDYTGLEGKKILVAEDNKINFFVANKFLVGWGITVVHAENGQIALDLMQKESFDLILMDLHMPVMDGIEAIRIIRNSDDPAISNIPIVALTAAIMSESHDKIADLRIDDYVLKPFKPHDLFERIQKHIK
jgi:PAS domain S-box-containing protein